MIVSLGMAPVAWLITLVGIGLVFQQWWRVPQMRQWDVGVTTGILSGTALLVLAALLWAVSASLSSVGPFLAGAGTLALGLYASTYIGMRQILRGVYHLPRELMNAVSVTLSPGALLPLGAMLVAVGLTGLVSRGQALREARA